MVGVPVHPVIDITTDEYLQILDWTGRQLAPGKRGRISPQAPAILKTMDHDAKCWATRVAAFGGGWYHVVGSTQGLIAMAERLGQQ